MFRENQIQGQRGHSNQEQDTAGCESTSTGLWVPTEAYEKEVTTGRPTCPRPAPKHGDLKLLGNLRDAAGKTSPS